MTQIHVVTDFGEVCLWGDPERLQGERPVLLAISGVFADPQGFLFRLGEKLPQADVFTAQLPGHFCPPLSETSIPAFAKAFDQVVGEQLSGRPILVCGESIGGTVVLAMDNPAIRRLALDPPLRTAGLWPLQERFARIYREQPGRRTFLENIFAFDGERFGDVDYTPLVKHRARVLIGDLPLLPVRNSSVMPGLLGEEERDWLRHSPLIQATTVQDAGHIMSKFEAGLATLLSGELAAAAASFRDGGRSDPSP